MTALPESVFNVLDVPFPGQGDGNHVEPDVVQPVGRVNVLLGGFAQPADLAGAHGGFGLPVRKVGAGFYLHENQQFFLAGNDVNFGPAVAVVAARNLVPLSPQVFARPILPPVA